MLTESRRWSERGLESLSPERAGSLQEMALQAAIGHATMITAGNTDAAREALERALRIAEELGDPLQQFRLLNSMHYYHRRIGAVDELFPIAEHAARIAPRLGGTGADRRGPGRCWAWPTTSRAISQRRIANLIAVRDAQLGASDGNQFLRLPSRRRSADCTYALAPGIP